MRNVRSSLAVLCLLAAAPLLTTSCKQDDKDLNEETNDRLDGDWEVRSWTLDGTEVVGFTVTSFDMEYDKEEVSTGRVQWTIINANGQTSPLDGDYTIKDDGTTIDVDGDEFDISVDGDKLELSGNVDATRWEIEARRD